MSLNVFLFQIDELRNRSNVSNIILLDSGGQFTGTLWFYKYAGQATSHFMNQLQYDAMVTSLLFLVSMYIYVHLACLP